MDIFEEFDIQLFCQELKDFEQTLNNNQLLAYNELIKCVISTWKSDSSSDQVETLLIEGGPGSGKSYLINQILKTIKICSRENETFNNYLTIDCCAMTKKVARRFNGNTIHSAFGVRVYEKGGEVFDQISEFSEKLVKQFGNDLRSVVKDETVLNFIHRSNLNLEKFKYNIRPTIKRQCNNRFFDNDTKKCAILYIDEISNLPLWLCYSIKEYISNYNNVFKIKPILIMTGDKFQTCPVSYKYSIFDYMFPDCKIFNLGIEENFRFTNDFHKFINHYRIAWPQTYEESLVILKENFINKSVLLFDSTQVTDDILSNVDRIITYKNDKTDYYNERKTKLMKISDTSTNIKIIYPIVNGVLLRHEKQFPSTLKEALINSNKPFELELVIGMPLFITRNTDTLSNGEYVELIDVPDNQEYILVKVENKNVPVQLSRITVPICKKIDIEHKFITEILQKQFRIPDTSHMAIYLSYFPISKGFSTTCHKCQGDTVDHNVLYDFTSQDKENCYSPNIIYTALSRVRSFNQIKAIVLPDLK
jgi:AAA domain